MTSLLTLYPIEVTTHNLYFHEEASIFSIDSFEDILATAGGDNAIRLWKIKHIIKNKKDVNFKYTTSLNSSIKLEFTGEIICHSKSVNCVRFNKSGFLASASDGGKIVLSKKGINIVLREQDGFDIYDLTWNKNILFVGVGNGHLEIYNIDKTVKLVHKQMIHSDYIQGITFNNKYNVLATLSKDRTAKLHLIVNDKLNNIDAFDNENERNIENFNDDCEKLNNLQNVKDIKNQINENTKDLDEENIENNCHNFKVLSTVENTSTSKKRKKIIKEKKTAFNSFQLLEKYDFFENEKMFNIGRSFFKRTCFSKDGLFLYLCNVKKNSVLVLHYPFRINHWVYKLGPLNSEPVAVLSNDDFLFILTKKSIYIYKNFELLMCVENICFKTATDATICGNTIFISSLDGFVSSFKWNS